MKQRSILCDWKCPPVIASLTAKVVLLLLLELQVEEPSTYIEEIVKVSQDLLALWDVLEVEVEESEIFAGLEEPS